MTHSWLSSCFASSFGHHHCLFSGRGRLNRLLERYSCSQRRFGLQSTSSTHLDPCASACDQAVVRIAAWKHQDTYPASAASKASQPSPLPEVTLTFSSSFSLIWRYFARGLHPTIYYKFSPKCCSRILG